MWCGGVVMCVWCAVHVWHVGICHVWVFVSGCVIHVVCACMCVYAVCVVCWLCTGSVGYVMCVDVCVQCVCCIYV